MVSQKRHGSLPCKLRGFGVVLWPVVFEEPVCDAGVGVELNLASGTAQCVFQELNIFGWLPFIVLRVVPKISGTCFGKICRPAAVKDHHRCNVVGVVCGCKQRPRTAHRKADRAQAILVNSVVMFEKCYSFIKSLFCCGTVHRLDQLLRFVDCGGCFAAVQVRCYGDKSFPCQSVTKLPEEPVQAPPRVQHHNTGTGAGSRNSNICRHLVGNICLVRYGIVLLVVMLP